MKLLEFTSEYRRAGANIVGIVEKLETGSENVLGAHRQASKRIARKMHDITIETGEF